MTIRANAVQANGLRNWLERRSARHSGISSLPGGKYLREKATPFKVLILSDYAFNGVSWALTYGVFITFSSSFDILYLSKIISKGLY